MALAVRRPRARRRERRSLIAVLLLLACASESVVDAERARGDDEISDARIVRQHDGNGSERFSGTATLVEDMRDGLGGEGTATMGLRERELDL